MLIALLLLFGAQDSVPQANPGRPTVSTPATLTPVGYLQFENGFMHARHSSEFSDRLGMNEVIKLAVTSRLQSLLEIEPVVRSTEGGGSRFHSGGIAAGLQGVLVRGHDSRPTIAVSYHRSLYDGSAPDIDIGSFRQSAMLLVSEDLWGFHFDANGITSEQVTDRGRRGQFGQTLSASHAWRKETIAGEIWHFSQPSVGGNAAGTLWAISHPIRPNIVVDAGFNRGLTHTSTRWETFAGFTYLLPHRLWKAKGAR